MKKKTGEIMAWFWKYIRDYPGAVVIGITWCLTQTLVGIALAALGYSRQMEAIAAVVNSINLIFLSMVAAGFVLAAMSAVQQLTRILKESKDGTIRVVVKGDDEDEWWKKGEGDGDDDDDDDDDEPGEG